MRALGGGGGGKRQLRREFKIPAVSLLEAKLELFILKSGFLFFFSSLHPSSLSATDEEGSAISHLEMHILMATDGSFNISPILVCCFFFLSRGMKTHTHQPFEQKS